jgi:hypothetical protein
MIGIVAATAASARSHACDQQLLVPAYFYPGTTSPWPALAASAAQTPTVVIVNPNSGPGTTIDPNYTAAITLVRGAGARTICYIATTYGVRPVAAMLAELQQYQALYGPFDGVFLDEMSNDPATLGHYQTFAAGIRAALPNALIVANPGTNIPASMSGTSVADVFVLYENDAEGGVPYAAYEPPAWALSQPPERVAHIVYNVQGEAAMRATVALARERRAGYVFVTDDVLANPYDTLPPYWSALASAAGDPCCDSIDFNGDGVAPDSGDLEDFLIVFAGGPCGTGTCGDSDFNNDGVAPDTADIDAFLLVFGGGSC